MLTGHAPLPLPDKQNDSPTDVQHRINVGSVSVPMAKHTTGAGSMSYVCQTVVTLDPGQIQSTWPPSVRV